MFHFKRSPSQGLDGQSNMLFTDPPPVFLDVRLLHFRYKLDLSRFLHADSVLILVMRSFCPNVSSSDIHISFPMTAATVARSSLNGLHQNAFANGDIWLRLMLEDHFQIPFQGARPVCQCRDRNTGSPVNFKAYWDSNHCKALLLRLGAVPERGFG